MFKYLFIVLALAMTACTSSTPGTPVPSVGCIIEGAVSGVVSVAVAQQLQCSNQAAIKASVDAAASKAGICKSDLAMAIGQAKPAQPVLKSVGGDICITVASTLISNLAAGAIPAEWGCTAASAQDSLKTLVVGACNKAFP